MKEFWNTIQLIFAAIGGWLGYFLGGFDGLLYALLAFVVSAFCRRNNLGGCTGSPSDNHPDINCCRCCGKPLTQQQGRKEVKFCSDICRRKWWNAHLDQVNRKANYEYTCAGCGRPFSAYGNSRRKYCSHECYIRTRFKGGDGHE